MTARVSIDPIQESNQFQAFLPIFMTLFFAAITSPMLMGWRGHDTSRSVSSDLLQVGFTENRIVAKQCELAEHQEAGRRCLCCRG
jgi:hypothetical protein